MDEPTITADDLAILRALPARLDALREELDIPQWSRPMELLDVAAAYACSRAKAKRLLESGTVRSKRLSRQSWLVDRRDLPTPNNQLASTRINSLPA